MKPLSLLVVVVLSCCILVGCTTKTKEEASVQFNQHCSDTAFYSFLKCFSVDSVYQINRIQFPLEYAYYDDYADEPSITKIDHADWRFINFSNDSIAKENREDAYVVRIERQSDDTVNYIRTGIDNGISVIYTFKKKANTWILVKIFDRSN